MPDLHRRSGGASWTSRHVVLAMPRRAAAVASTLAVLLVSAAPGAAGAVATAAPGAVTDEAGAGRGTAVGTVKGDCTGANCLALTIDQDGSIGGVKEGARAIPLNGTNGGFSVRMVGNQPNLLSNPGFESTSGWTFPTTGTNKPARVADGDAGHAGAWAARVAISGSTPRTSAVATQVVNVTPNTNYTIGAWFKTTGIGPNSTETTAPLTYREDLAPVAVRVEMLTSGNQLIRTNWVYGYTGTTTWHQNSIGVKTVSNAAKLRIGIGVRSGYGTVLFDDLSVRRLFSPTKSPLPMTATNEGGGTISQTGNVGGQPLEVTASTTSTAKGIEITGFVRNTSAGGGSVATDRALQLSYTLPINATGWQWGDTPRTSRTITAGGVYYFENNFTSPTARYPWATVFDAASGLSVGAPLTRPRAYGLRYDASGLTITFDLGVSKSATTLNSRASFKIQLFRSDETYRQGSAWGFRGAIAKYYAQNPGSFERKPQLTPAREGIPFYQPPISPPTAGGLTLANAKKLHLGLNVLTSNNIRQQTYGDWGERGPNENQPINIYSAVYTHHWGLFQQRCANGTANCATRTYAQVIARIQADSTMSCAPNAATCQSQKAHARAALQSSAKDMNGRFRYDLSDDEKEYRIRQIPGLELGTNPEWFEAARVHQMATPKGDAAAPPNASSLDAIYIDSTSGMRAVWGDVDDYDRDHWAALPEPASLSFSYQSGRVVLQSFFANYLQLRQIATWAAANNVFLVLDTNGKEHTPGGILATDMADWLLMENSLRDLELPPPGVTPDSYGILKRTLARQRPVTSVDPKLVNSTFPFGPTTETSSTPLATDSVVARVNESLFYGIYPGPDRWNYNTVSPAWYKSAKYIALYEKYGKLLRRLSAAGWEPITMAKSSNASVFLERYGSIAGDDLIIAIRNATSSAKTSTITVQFDAAAPGATATELVRHRALAGYSVNGPGTVATFSVNVPAGVTLLVAFAP